MTGWRVGYCAAQAIGAIQSQTAGSPSSISQKAACAALAGSQAPVKRMVRAFKMRRDFVAKRLHEMGISCVRPKGAFYVFPEAPFGGGSFSSFLLEKAQVAVVPGKEFGSEAHFRISYATDMKILEKGMDRLEKACAKSRDRD